MLLLRDSLPLPPQLDSRLCIIASRAAVFTRGAVVRPVSARGEILRHRSVNVVSNFSNFPLENNVLLVQTVQETLPEQQWHNYCVEKPGKMGD